MIKLKIVAKAGVQGSIIFNHKNTSHFIAPSLFENVRLPSPVFRQAQEPDGLYLSYFEAAKKSSPPFPGKPDFLYFTLFARSNS
jgi:hypothetical protein